MKRRIGLERVTIHPQRDHGQLQPGRQAAAKALRKEIVDQVHLQADRRPHGARGADDRIPFRLRRGAQMPEPLHHRLT